MPHARSAIRALVVAQLQTGTPALASNVTNTRTTRVGSEHKPAIDVHTPDDGARREGLSLDADGLIQRALVVRIRAYVEANDDVATPMDELCAAIEQRMALLPVDYQAQLASTSIEYEMEGERPMAEATLDYEITYFTRANDPSTLF